MRLILSLVGEAKKDSNNRARNYKNWHDDLYIEIFFRLILRLVEEVKRNSNNRVQNYKKNRDDHLYIEMCAIFPLAKGAQRIRVNVAKLKVLIKFCSLHFMDYYAELQQLVRRFLRKLFLSLLRC